MTSEVMVVALPPFHPEFSMRLQRPARTLVRRLTAAAGTLALSAALLTTTGSGASPEALSDTVALAAATAQAKTVKAKQRSGTNPVTPGNFTGFGFDQCVAPTQKAMDAWLNHSPYLAVGIYISGDSRACRVQPNLTPTWISTQLAKGWRLLPIALGPQASCLGRFPRYDDDFKISPRPGKKGRYPKARAQGRAEAEKNSADAAALGLAKGSTIWYDLEAFDMGNKHCRESALAFVSAWTNKIQQLGWASGMYSSASSGIKMLDDARVNRPGKFHLPTYIWLARWDGKANTSSSYIREDGWRPGRRMKQYFGGHHETHGKVTINIDSNYLDLGATARSSDARCGGVQMSFKKYPTITTSHRPRKRMRALQCLLQEQGFWEGKLHGKYGPRVRNAVATWQTSRGLPASTTVDPSQWMRLLAVGEQPTLKMGSSGAAVHRLQQTLIAAGLRTTRSTGVFDSETRAQVRAYQKPRKMRAHGVANPPTWRALSAGNR
ncbi:DUF1906 domain-containing protein [Nocardioides sp. Y6]|uniref:DUF1906 domain-containing protein n=1 Tax=Nocardioides malaquae TaxID=2773426 RepID=A0ABR9RWA1_9ACTN|nr:glycoside hydrolase domain-containing protein [Nocardioides malaquae]MBE7325854.1 DUF1906 domain-containing protein [Nocardioides malaquae]